MVAKKWLWVVLLLFLLNYLEKYQKLIIKKLEKNLAEKSYLAEVMNEIKKWGFLSAPTSLSIFIKKDKITES
jgi:hypothetical protein